VERFLAGIYHKVGLLGTERGAICAIIDCEGRKVIMARERLVVIGGDAAGMSAASQARRRRADLEIIAFERSPHTSYSA
jgi:hypothetical protein